nr:DNA resolvase [Ochrobactrum sp. CM-21-5]
MKSSAQREALAAPQFLCRDESLQQNLIEAIKEGMFHPSMKGEMDSLEARKAALADLLADAPADTPDILPSASAIYAKKVAALTTALNQKEERQAASQDLRALIEKIVLTPGPERGEIYATLHGELGTILNWVERQAIGKAGKTTKPAVGPAGLLESVVAGARCNCWHKTRWTIGFFSLREVDNAEQLAA